MAVKIKTAVSIILGLSVAALCAAGPPADFWIEGGRTVVDQSHRRITVHQPFNRIISLYGAHSENLFALGCREQLIGVSPHEDYPPEAAQKPVFSYHDDPEKFLAARPDLVLTRPMIDRGYPQFVQRLEKSGITVVSLQPGTVEEMIGYWRILGILTGREDPAKHMADRFNRTVARLRLLTADIHPAADAQPVRDTNIAAYGKERILAKAAGIDVFLAQSGTMNQPTVELIKAESGFRAIRAVQTGQVHIIDERLVSRPTLRLLDGIFEIGKILYPDDFPEKARKIIEEAKD